MEELAFHIKKGILTTETPNNESVFKYNFNLLN